MTLNQRFETLKNHIQAIAQLLDDEEMVEVYLTIVKITKGGSGEIFSIPGRNRCTEGQIIHDNLRVYLQDLMVEEPSSLTLDLDIPGEEWETQLAYVVGLLLAGNQRTQTNEQILKNYFKMGFTRRTYQLFVEQGTLYLHTVQHITPSILENMHEVDFIEVLLPRARELREE
ncbi:10989_t:CDS:2, partial [Acaulospora morrowiae]